eukprot:jgi/Galph1/3789/GphlegSOOS_G2467.1
MKKLLEQKEKEAREEMFRTYENVLDGTLKSKISSCSEDINDKEERMDPMLIKEKEAANFLAEHANMVRNGTWKKKREEQEKKLKEEALKKQQADSNLSVVSHVTKENEETQEYTKRTQQKETPTKQVSAPPRRTILRFLCCTVVEETCS